jgi:hypothetical protein
MAVRVERDVLLEVLQRPVVVVLLDPRRGALGQGLALPRGDLVGTGELGDRFVELPGLQQLASFPRDDHRRVGSVPPELFVRRIQPLDPGDVGRGARVLAFEHREREHAGHQLIGPLRRHGGGSS